jgi:hypothetical protein
MVLVLHQVQEGITCEELASLSKKFKEDQGKQSRVVKAQFDRLQHKITSLTMGVTDQGED